MIAADYKKIFYTLLPAGPIWPSQAGEAPNWDKLAAAISLELGRVDDQAREFVLEAIPDATDYDYPSVLLDAWERVAGLPDAYTPEGQTDEERVIALIAKLRGTGSPVLAKFASILAIYTSYYAVFDNYRLVDSLETTWTVGGTATVSYNAAPDPDGATTAEVVLLPAASDSIHAHMLRIANYEAVWLEFFVRLAGGGTHTATIAVYGRDAAAKSTQTVAISSTWQHFVIAVSDVGTGASDPYLSIALATGADVTLHIAGARGGWRERYYPIFAAGSVCGEPPAAGWAHTFGLEYGIDLISRAPGGKISWATSNMTVTEDTVPEPVSRSQVAYSLVPSGAVNYGEFSIGTAIRYVRYSFWLKFNATQNTITISTYNRSGTLIAAQSVVVGDDWQKYDVEVDNGASGATLPKLRIEVPNGTTLYFAHARASEINTELEGRIGQAAPLHTTPLFHSYGELTQCTE